MRSLKFASLLIIMVVFGIIFLTAMRQTSATGTTYYVAPNGNDSNPGTASQPWRAIQKAADSVSAGDTVIVQAGAYQEQVTISASGTASDPILFQAQGTAELNGFVLAGDYLQIKGFTVKVLSCSLAEFGFKVTGSYFLIEGNNIIETVDGGISTWPDTVGGVIRNNYFYRNAQTSIELHGQDHLIENNEIRRPIEDHPTCPSDNDDANGIDLFGSGHVIRGNYIHEVQYGPDVDRAHMDCIQSYGGWRSGDPARNTNILIEKNICEALSYQRTDEWGNGVQLEKVSSDDNTYERGIIVRNNLIMAVICGAVQQDAAYITFVNNTCVTTPELGVIASGMDYWPGTNYDNHHYRIQNNIYYNFVDPLYVNTSVLNGGATTISHNLAYLANGSTPSSTAFACNQDNNICADPLFVNAVIDPVSGDFHLQPGAPAIDAGANLSPVVSDDLEGVARPQGGGYDVGAYEYVTSGPGSVIFLPSISSGSIEGVSLADEDILKYETGSDSWFKYFDGSAHGFGAENIDAVFIQH